MFNLEFPDACVGIKKMVKYPMSCKCPLPVSYRTSFPRLFMPCYTSSRCSPCQRTVAAGSVVKADVTQRIGGKVPSICKAERGHSLIPRPFSDKAIHSLRRRRVVASIHCSISFSERRDFSALSSFSFISWNLGRIACQSPLSRASS